jgi:hypothetical protein
VEEKPTSNIAQPLTFGGIAGLASCSSGRWFSWMAVVAAFSAVVVLVFLEIAWTPVIHETIGLLPEKGLVERQQLRWEGNAPIRVTKGRFLCIIIDPEEILGKGQAADLQFEFGLREVKVRSLFGYLSVPYPPGITVAANRAEVEPWWGAWRPALAAMIGVGVVLSLFLIWGFLATLYFWPAWCVGFYTDRQITSFRAWRLSAASLLPGALLMDVAILGYAFHHLNLVQFLFAALLHIVIGWVYLLLSPFWLPRVNAQPRNPFKAAKPKNRNPFAAGDRG